MTVTKIVDITRKYVLYMYRVNIIVINNIIDKLTCLSLIVHLIRRMCVWVLLDFWLERWTLMTCLDLWLEQWTSVIWFVTRTMDVSDLTYDSNGEYQWLGLIWNSEKITRDLTWQFMTYQQVCNYDMTFLSSHIHGETIGQTIKLFVTWSGHNSVKKGPSWSGFICYDISYMLWHKLYIMT